jgi:hypothetical protein
MHVDAQWSCREMGRSRYVDVLLVFSSHVNRRHMALLVFVMTQCGLLMAINRPAINRNDMGALVRCSSEKRSRSSTRFGINKSIASGVKAMVRAGQPFSLLA